MEVTCGSEAPSHCPMGKNPWGARVEAGRWLGGPSIGPERDGWQGLGGGPVGVADHGRVRMGCRLGEI